MGFLLSSSEYQNFALSATRLLGNNQRKNEEELLLC